MGLRLKQDCILWVTRILHSINVFYEVFICTRSMASGGDIGYNKIALSKHLGKYRDLVALAPKKLTV